MPHRTYQNFSSPRIPDILQFPQNVGFGGGESVRAENLGEPGEGFALATVGFDELRALFEEFLGSRSIGMDRSNFGEGVGNELVPGCVAIPAERLDRLTQHSVFGEGEMIVCINGE